MFYLRETVNDSSFFHSVHVPEEKQGGGGGGGGGGGYPSSSFEAFASFAGRYASGTLELYTTSRLSDGKGREWKQKRKKRNVHFKLTQRRFDYKTYD